MTSNLPHGPCAVCKTVTSKLCSGCRDAPSYNSSPSNSGANQTFYCSSACQKSHWENHKSECHNLQGRKKLLRAARILHGMTLSICRHATRCRFDRLSVNTAEKGDTVKVLLEEPMVLPREAQWTLVPFPDTPKDLDANILEGLMVHGACAEAQGYMEVWVKQLLSGICSSIEEVNLELHGGTKLQIFVLDKNNNILAPCTSHFVYRVVLRGSGEIWAVDPTGKQYGYSEVTYGWNELDRCGWTINQVGPVGTNPWAIVQMETIEKKELSDAINKNIPLWAKKHGGGKGNISGILKGSDAAFGEVERKFLGEVEDTIKGYMARYNLPEETKKRNAEMMALLPDLDDPEVMKNLRDGMKEMSLEYNNRK